LLNARLVRLLVAAWADDAYPDGRDDVRGVLRRLAEEAHVARDRGNEEEADGCERTADLLDEHWARATHELLDDQCGHPAWTGLADRLWDEHPAAPLDDV